MGMALTDEAATPATALADPQSGGTPATGYLIIGGLVTARQARAGAAVNRWLSEHGLQAPAPPLRIVVSGRRLWAYVANAGRLASGAALDERLGTPRAWREIRVGETPFPAGQARIAANTQVIESSPERAMLQLLQRLPS
jgi:hypothetical protein